MVEAVSVLERTYHVPRMEVAAAIEGLLRSEALVIEREPLVFTAMVAVKQGRGGFADALIGALGLSVGCRHTVAFDRAASALDGFVAV